MKHSWPARLGLSFILIGAFGPTGWCQSPKSVCCISQPQPGAATFAIVNGNGFAEYSTANGSLLGTLTLPPSDQYYGSPIAIDGRGQIYVSTITGGAIYPNEILVFPPNSTGAAAPTRTINITNLNRLAVDPTGRVYVLNLSTNPYGPPTVDVYTSNASGPATPFRTLQLTTMVPAPSDMVADEAGNIYVAGYIGNSWTIAVYPYTANGPSTPTRTIVFGANAYVYGVAIDRVGHIFANVGTYNFGNGPDVIEEFARGAKGAATPINTINLTAGSAWSIDAGGPVRVDGAGNIFTSLVLDSKQNPFQMQYDLIGFAPGATGDATPTLDINPDGGFNTFLAVN